MERMPPPRRRSRFPTWRRLGLQTFRDIVSRIPRSVSLTTFKAPAEPLGGPASTAASSGHDSRIPRSISLATLATCAATAEPLGGPASTAASSGHGSRIPRSVSLATLATCRASARDMSAPRTPQHVQHDHTHCQIALDLLKRENQDLKSALNRIKKEIQCLRMEFGAHGRRVGLQRSSVDDLLRSHSCVDLFERDASETESEDFDDIDRSISEFWSKRSQATEVPGGKEAFSDLPSEDSLAKVQASGGEGGAAHSLVPPFKPTKIKRAYSEDCISKPILKMPENALHKFLLKRAKKRRQAKEAGAKKKQK
ncbi:uncharacterized protein LOC132204525 [Neocloeon triangulifer]|uniref:uncharacterized protein LOC132204525 n=1 Tax=Neocloeon triangulifer TaxID=2078957 RepID=UPI00286F8474|nr:uncharacterized protein LOC132204525 [Neocloeon triangulifer]